MSDAKIIAFVLGVCTVVACAVAGSLIAARMRAREHLPRSIEIATPPPMPATQPESNVKPLPTTRPITPSRPTPPTGTIATFAYRLDLRDSHPEPTYKAIPLSQYMRLTKDKDEATRVTALEALGRFDREEAAADALRVFVEGHNRLSDSEALAAVRSYAAVTWHVEPCIEVARQRFDFWRDRQESSDWGARIRIEMMMRWLESYSYFTNAKSDKGELFSMLRDVVRDLHAPRVASNLRLLFDRHPDAARLLAREIASRARDAETFDWQELVATATKFLAEPDTIGIPPSGELVVPKPRARNDGAGGKVGNN